MPKRGPQRPQREDEPPQLAAAQQQPPISLSDLDLDGDNEESLSGGSESAEGEEEDGSEGNLQFPSDEDDEPSSGDEGDPTRGLQAEDDDAAIQAALDDYMRATQNLRAQGPGRAPETSEEEDAAVQGETGPSGHAHTRSKASKPDSSSSGSGKGSLPSSSGGSQQKRSVLSQGGSNHRHKAREGVGQQQPQQQEQQQQQQHSLDQGGTQAQVESSSSEEADDQPGLSGRPLDPGSDSSEDERENRNTVGNVPLWWYKDEDHIGYDKDGKKIIKKGRGDKLDALLQRNDSKKAMRTIYDEYNDEEVVLSKDELRMIMAIRKGQFPHVEVNPYEPEINWFTKEQEKMPINGAPEPKRRFIPSKHEEQKIVKLVRAIRKGWLKTEAEKEKPQEAPVYLMWGDDGLAGEEGAAKTATGLSYIPPAKPRLPGHAESYNPPAEYIPTEEEVAGYAMLDPEDRPKLIPQKFNSLREVPAYSRFINDIFERCLDLYLCPRVRKKRLHVDPDSLVPKLPKPADLQPFPTTLAMRYLGHTSKVRSIAPDASGQWLLSGSEDGTAKMWEVSTGRCVNTWNLGSPVVCVAWCPAPGMKVVSAVYGNSIALLPTSIGNEEEQAAGTQALDSALEAAASYQQGAINAGQTPLATWSRRADGGIDIAHKFQVKHVAWHNRGDYFSTVAPAGNTQAVLVHQLSKGATQNPFRKNRGRVQRVAFHPTKPFFFVASQNHVRIYNLAKQALSKKLVGSSGTITCLAIHPTGDHVLVGSDDRRLAWYDLDLSDKPYKALRYHTTGLRGTAFHRSYPLFASCADDAAVHVFHGMVYSDLLTNPLLVPLKVLRGHTVTDYSGVLDVAFHPTQPWLFTAGGDASICLFCN